MADVDEVGTIILPLPSDNSRPLVSKLNTPLCSAFNERVKMLTVPVNAPVNDSPRLLKLVPLSEFDVNPATSN